MALFIFVLAITVLFSLIFVPIFFSAWRQEEEHWKRHTRQLALVPVETPRGT